MVRRAWLPTVLLLLIGLSASPGAAAAAGSGWRLAAAVAVPDSVQVVQVSLEGDRLRLAVPGESRELVLDPEAVLVVDHARRTFTRVSFEQLDNTLGLVADAMKQARRMQRKALAEALESASGDERARLQKQLDALGPGGPPPGEIRFEKTGRTTRIAGLAAERVLVLAGGEPQAVMWVAQEIPVEPLRAMLARLARLAPLQKQVAEWQVQVLLDVPGFPLRVAGLAHGEEEDFLRVTKAERADFDAAFFSPPAGYKEQPLDLGGLSR